MAADRLHRARQHGRADGRQSAEGRASGRRLRPVAPRRWTRCAEAGGTRRGERRRRRGRARDRSSPCCRPGRRCARSMSATAASSPAARQGALLIDCSTIDVATRARASPRQRPRRGFDMLDAPVSGGVGGAAAARLTFMVGGSEAAFARALAGAAGDGQDHRPCRPLGQRPGRQDLQQHDPRHLDDRGVARPSRWPSGSASTARSCSTSARNRRASAGR